MSFAFALLVVVALSSYWSLQRVGVFADDWMHATSFVFRPHTSLIRQATGSAVADSRPFLAIPLTLMGLAYRIGGVPAGLVLVGTMVTLDALVFTLLVRRRLPAALSVVCGLFYVLFPADTTQLWIVTFNLRFAVLLALLACHAFATRHDLLAGTLLLLAFLTWEIAPVIFLLAPWFSGDTFRPAVKRAVQTLALSAVVFLAVRVALPFVSPARDTRVANVVQLFSGIATVDSYVARFPDTLYLAFLKWPGRALRRAIDADGRLSFALAAGVLAGLAAVFRRSFPTERGSLRASFSVPPGEPWRWTIGGDDRTGMMLAGLAWSAVGVMGGAGLSFVASPNFGWAQVTRLNVPFIPAAALGLTLSLALCARLARSLRARVFVALCGVILLASFFSFRWRIRDQYVEATRVQRLILRDMISDLGALPAGSEVFVLVDLPVSRNRAVFPLAPKRSLETDDFPNEIPAIFSGLYGPAVSGRVFWEEATLERALAEAGRGREGGVLLYRVSSRQVRWLLPAPLTARPVQPGGPARAYVEAEA